MFSGTIWFDFIYVLRMLIFCCMNDYMPMNDGVVNKYIELNILKFMTWI